MTNQISFKNGVLTIVTGQGKSKLGLPRNIRPAKNGRFQATITHKGKALSLGIYDSLQEAIAARDLGESCKTIQIVKR